MNHQEMKNVLGKFSCLGESSGNSIECYKGSCIYFENRLKYLTNFGRLRYATERARCFYNLMGHKKNLVILRIGYTLCRFFSKQHLMTEHHISIT